MTTLPTWQEVWQRGLSPLLSDEELAALADALRTDSPQLVQGSTTVPPPLMCMQDYPCEAGCVLGFVGALRAGGFGDATVGACEETFARLCFEADEAMGGAGSCRALLNFFDDTPRATAFPDLLAEVESTLEGRKARAA